MKTERGMQEAEIILVTQEGEDKQNSCQPFGGPGRPPDGPCSPMKLPCNPQCSPACVPSVIPRPCGPTRGDPRPPSPPRPS